MISDILTFTHDPSRTKRVTQRAFTAIAGSCVDTFAVQTQLWEELALIHNCNAKSVTIELYNTRSH